MKREPPSSQDSDAEPESRFIDKTGLGLSVDNSQAKGPLFDLRLKPDRLSNSPFRVLDGGEPDKPKRRARTLTPWECRFCWADIGVKTRDLIKVRSQPFQDGQLRITGGRDVWVCAYCLARGKHTPVTA